jgi:fatty acid desaturase
MTDLNTTHDRSAALGRDDVGAAPLDREWLQDHSDTFGPLRSIIETTDGRSYRAMRSDLEPRWAQVWADLGVTIAAVAIAPIAMSRIERALGKRAVFVAPVAAAAIGTAVHRLGLFIHEGAHYNLAPGKSASDRLANATVGVVVLTDVRAYRPIHMAHHRKLGQADDPERSYFEPLDRRFVARGLLGANVLLAMRQRLNGLQPSDPPPSKLVPLAGAALHAGIILGLLRRGRPATAASWAVGVGSVYPLLNTARQWLEHRDEFARSDIPYEEASHGVVTRMFTTGPLSMILGGAGFNRHLLHHWDASISYTRLRDLEQSLQSTAAGPVIRARNGSYAATFRRLRRATGRR